MKFIKTDKKEKDAVVDGYSPQRNNNKKIIIILRRFMKNKMAMLGFIMLCIILFFAIFANLFSTYDAAVTQNVYNKLLAPCDEYIFGTDAYGRDIFARIIFGARLSLAISFFTVVIAVVVGTIIGSVAAYYGGTIDNITMRIIDIFMAIPTTLMAVTVVAALGTSIPNLIIALALSLIPPFVRIVRSTVLQVKAADYIEAARAYGSNDAKIIFHHILPNSLGPIIVQATLNLAGVLLSVAALGFIGLGVPAPRPEWGTMLAEAKVNMRYYPYLVIIPGIAIAMTVLSINLIGDGLRDALDPRLKN